MKSYCMIDIMQCSGSGDIGSDLISRTATDNRAYMLFTTLINCETVFYSLVAS